MNNIEEFFQLSHYKFMRILLGISGLWPFQTLYRRCAVYILFVLVAGTGMIFEVLGTIDVWNDTFELLDCIPLLSLAIETFIRLFCAVYTLPKIKKLLIKMKEHCLSPKSEQETKIQQSHTLYGRNLGYVYAAFFKHVYHELRKSRKLTFMYKLVMIGSQSATFLFTNVLTKIMYTESAESKTTNKIQGAQTGIPYRVNYMVDVDTYYVPIFIHTAICEMSYVFMSITLEVLYVTFVEHCCSLFAAVRYRLETCFEFENDSDELIARSTKTKSYSNIVYSIRKHVEATKFVAIMESVYTIPLFVHVGATMVVLSIIGFQMITNTENINRFLIHTTYMNALLFNIFFENWQGQKIIESSEKVYQAAYNAKWYNMPTATKKLLLIVMLRSRKPTEISAGKVIVMSYLTFSAVVRTASSYFMLLRSL